MTNNSSADSKTISIAVPATADLCSITGEADSNLKMLQDAFDAQISMRGNEIRIHGEIADVESLALIFEDLLEQASNGECIDETYLRGAIELRHRLEFSPSSLRGDVLLTHRGRSIHPKTPGQKRYVDSIRNNTITFGCGPAGTGKTYLAMAMAISALNRKEVGRVVLSRPILEAGENLGFLPGTLTEKVDPYIRPLYDALFDMVDGERASEMLDTGMIEIAPLAFMRGRTLNDSFVILDEAQNTTPEQMKMFLTRLGFGSKMVITGDLSQSDLPRNTSGLLQAQSVLAGTDDIAFCEFKSSDVVRNPLVASIIAAYERHLQSR